jgi:hypothetical protein
MNCQRDIGGRLTRSRPRKWSTSGSSLLVTPGQLWREPPPPIALENGRWIPVATAQIHCIRWGRRRDRLDQNWEAHRRAGRWREANHDRRSPPPFRFRIEQGERAGGGRGEDWNPNCLRTRPGGPHLSVNFPRRKRADRCHVILTGGSHLLETLLIGRNSTINGHC